MSRLLANLWGPAVGFVAMTSLLALSSCSATGSAVGDFEIDPPFMDPLQVKLEVSNDKKTWATKGPDEIPNDYSDRCIELRWSDKDGADLGGSEASTDRSGFASGQVPPGAVRWQAKLVDCPEPEGDGDGLARSPFGTQTPGHGGERSDQVGKLPIRTFLVCGGPIVPSDELGVKNLTYAFLVKATGFAEAGAFVAPILSGGIGSTVPKAVEIVNYSTMERQLNGGHFVSATTDTYIDYTLDFNGGAFVADLAKGQNVLTYSTQGWHVADTTIPLEYFQASPMPGKTSRNKGVLTIRTDRHPHEVQVSSQTLTVKN